MSSEEQTAKDVVLMRRALDEVENPASKRVSLTRKVRRAKKKKRKNQRQARRQTRK